MLESSFLVENENFSVRGIRREMVGDKNPQGFFPPSKEDLP